MRSGSFDNEYFANCLKFVLQKNMPLLFMNCSKLKYLRRWLWKKIGDPTLVTLPRATDALYFWYISCKKTSTFRKSKNWSYNPWFVGVGHLCGSQTFPYLSRILLTASNSFFGHDTNCCFTWLLCQQSKFAKVASAVKSFDFFFGTGTVLKLFLKDYYISFSNLNSVSLFEWHFS